jgi:hypothetical protein
VFERAYARVFLRRSGGIKNDGVTDLAIVADHLAGIAAMLAVVTTKTSIRPQMADVIRMSLPVSLHLGKEVDLIDPLDLRDCTIN